MTEIDPKDAAAWYRAGATLPDTDDPSRPAGPKQAKEQIALYAKVLERNPYMTPAIYNMALTSRFANEPEKTKGLFEQFRRMNPDRPDPSPGPGESIKTYGEMGKYATVINPFPRPVPTAEGTATPLNFEAARPFQVKLAAGEQWVKPSDFTGSRAVFGRVRARFGAGVAAFDADGDGQLDLFLASAVVGTKGDSRRLALEQRGRPLRGCFGFVRAAQGSSPASASPRPTSTPIATSMFS